MKLLSIIILAILVIFVSGRDISRKEDINWNKVVPIYEISQFWDDKSPALKEKFANSGKRIIGGQIAAPNQFPYQAAIILNTAGLHAICGGSIISNVVNFNISLKTIKLINSQIAF